MAALALSTSLVVHASVVVAVASAPQGGAIGVTPGATVNVQEETVAPQVIALEPPRPAVMAEAPESPPNVVVHVAPNPSTARAETASHPASAHTDGAPDVAPDVALAPPATSARFVMAFGTATTATGGLAPFAGSDETGTATYAESGVSSRARLLEGTPPVYPPAARAAAVEADLPLEIVVDAKGTVVDARLLKHAGYGLDEAALSAVRAYRFIPAQRAGHGVSVRMRWVVDFRLD